MNQYQGFDENLSLEGKTAVITGGASGIGRATAGMMVRKGGRVVILDRDPRVGDSWPYG